MRLKKDFWHLGLACLSLGCVLATVKSEKDAEVDPLQTQQDFNNPKVRGGCPLSGQFRNKDTRCWVRSVPPSSPQNAGENSYCRVVSGPKPGLYSCKQGTWIPAVPNTEKPSNRGKRWWWGSRSRQPKPKKPPNKPPYFTYCPRDIQVTARANENDAVAIFTVQADDKEGKATLKLNEGKKSGGRFSEGPTYVRYTATDSQGLTASCTFWVKVIVYKCPRVAQLASFPFGSQSCSGTEKNIYGSLCRHTCLPGYTLRGPAVVTCLSSRTWSSAFPSCKAVSCGNPVQVAHGSMVCPRGYSYPHGCTVHCNKGYENVGVRYPVCGSDGQWIPPYSHCTAQKKRNAVEQGGESVVREDTPRSSSTPTPPPPPPPPNQAPYFTSCPADINVTAPADQKDAIVTFSVQAADKEGHVTLTLNQGAGSGSRFREGETFVSYSAIDTGGLTASCSFHVRVTVNRCPYVAELSRFSQGSQSCSGTEKNLYGSVCHHTCDVGHVLKGQAQVTCQSSRSWSSAFPSCQPVSCGDPGMVAGGQVACPQGHVYPYTCIVQCQPGYYNSNVTTATCGSTGQWSAQFSPCIDIEVPQFPNGCPPSQKLDSGPLEDPVTVTWIDPVVTDNSNQDVTLTSDLVKGSKQGPGQHRVTLTATDKAGNEQKCYFHITIEAKHCPTLLPPDDGQYTCTRNNVEGSACTASCDLGYSLNGTATLLCLPSEQWDNSPPTCEATTCTPPSVDHGSFVCPSGYQHPAQCELKCDEGFQVQAPDQIQCLENATWSATGSCKDVQAPQFLSGCPLDIQQYASPLGSDTVATWTPPAITDNSRDAVDLQSDVTPSASFQPGTTMVTYKATDTAGNVASCSFSVTVIVIECLNPSDELTADDMAANVYTCADGYVHGAACTVNCTQGYALVGESTITCKQDNRTYPPTAHWQWAEGLSGKPVCREDKCPIPAAPKNGALSCHLGTLGTICQVSCSQDWDLSHNLTDHLSCINERGTWSSDVNVVETGCVIRQRPNQQDSKANVHYFAGSCNSSTEELRQAYVIRMQGSVLKDACTGVPSCTAKNVKVFCGPIWPSQAERRKRGAGNERASPEDTAALRGAFFQRGGYRRLNSTHYYHKDSSDVHVPFAEGEQFPGRTFQKDPWNHGLLKGASGGKVHVGHLGMGESEEVGGGPLPPRNPSPS